LKTWEWTPSVRFAWSSFTP